MSTGVVIPYAYPVTNDDNTRPLTEGEVKTVAGTEPTQDESLWGRVENWWEDTTASISDAAARLTSSAIDKEVTDAEKRITSVNDPVAATNTPVANDEIFGVNKTLVVGGGVVLAGLVLFMVLRK